MREDRKEHPDVKRSMQLFLKWLHGLEELSFHSENYSADKVAMVMAPLNLQLEKSLYQLGQLFEESKENGTDNALLAPKTKPVLRLIKNKG